MLKIFEEIKKRTSVIQHMLVGRSEELGYDPRLVFRADPQSIITEQYQMIRTNLSLAIASGEDVKTLLMTSSQANEGKSVTSANLALAFAKDFDKKTILLDADMRRPTQHKLFHIESKPGLTDILQGHKQIEEVVGKIVVDNLTIVPAGSLIEDPREIIGSAAMQNLISRLREQFDYIIFDSPPVLSVSDSLIIASMLDMTILIVRANLTPEKHIKESLRALREANTNFMGSILTGYIEYSSLYSESYKYRYGYQNDPKK